MRTGAAQPLALPATFVSAIRVAEGGDQFRGATPRCVKGTTMLVLTRRENERIVLPTLKTSIQVVRIAGSTVRLGIEAPANVPVLREELLKENKAPEDAARKLQVPCLDSFPETLEHSHNAASAPASRLSQQEKLLDCLALACDLADTHLANGKVAEARETIQKALELLRRLGARSVVAASSPVRVSGQRVALVIEPTKSEGSSMSQVLRKAGYSVISFASGCRAIDYLASHNRPDLIVINLQENRPCAADTIRMIRQNPALRGVKVVALSDSRPAEAEISIGPQGVDYWFATQTCPERILRQIEA